MSASEPGQSVSEIARQVLTKTLRLRRGESVIVESWTHMLPWARAFVLEARRMGVRPMVLYEDEETYWSSVESAKASDIGHMSDPELAALAKTQAYVFLWGPEDRPRFNALPSEQRQALQAYGDRWYEVAEKARLRGCRMELGRATASMARFYGVSWEGWQEELRQASLVDPKSLARDGARVAKALAKRGTVRISHANGTDLELQLVGRKPVVDDGIVDEQDVRSGNNLTSIPAGAVYVAVDEKHARGRFVANRSSFLSKGVVSGGRWSFDEDRLKEFEYGEGAAVFQEPFEAAGAGRDQPGLISIGLNPKIRLSPGMEDLERGAVLLAIGSNTVYGGKTRIPFQSWLVLAGAHVEINGKVVAADGEIL
jgi:leucyl aminopeptidase (aminopeptidase T)